jgi:exosome complex component RRP4
MKRIRDVVFPSQLLGDVKKYRAGEGTFVEDGRIYAKRIGIKNIKEGIISVSPLKGNYEPHAGDVVIGIIEEVSTSTWLVDINAIYPALLHVNEVPWRIEFGDTARYLNYGDVVMAKVLSSSEPDKLQITLKERGLYKINTGTIIEVEPTKVPRVIGRNGSMITLLKKLTNCRILVGKNGRIWVDGEVEGIQKIEKAIRLIERDAHTYGLTERVTALLRG